MTLDDEGLRWSASGSERTEARGRWACRCAGMSAAEGDGGGAYRRARNDGQESQGSERATKAPRATEGAKSSQGSFASLSFVLPFALPFATRSRESVKYEYLPCGVVCHVGSTHWIVSD